MQIPNWKCSVAQRFAAAIGSSACLRNHWAKGSSFRAATNERARSTNVRGGESRKELGDWPRDEAEDEIEGRVSWEVWV